MKTDITPLPQPLQIGNLRLRNRFVMPGMQRAWCVDGAPTHRLRDYYRRRALGGTALVISEAVAADHPSAASNRLFGRSRIGDPDWVAKMSDGREIRPFRRADIDFMSA